MAQRSTAANEVAPLNLQEKPILPMLINMSTQSRDRIRIIERIGANYASLGALLLEDPDGSRIEGIVAAHPQEPTYYILTSWLQGGGREPVIWATLIDVLKQAGLKQLAQDIEKQAKPSQHVHSPPSPAENEPSARAQPLLLTTAVPGSAASPLPRGSQQSVGPAPNAGQVQEQQGRESVGESDLVRSSDEVKRKTEALKKAFQKLKITIKECLEKHKVLVKKVADVLTQLSPDDDEYHKIFLESHVKHLDEAANHSQLFLTMNSHWNYLDPSLLDHMVNELELDDVKEEMEAYEEDLQKFRKKTPLALFCVTQKKKKKELPQGFNEVVAKFKKTSDVDVTLEIVEQFRQEYASHYSVHEFAMMLAQVRPGSFIITLFIPESIVEKLKESDNVPRDILEKYSVTKLKVAGTIIYPDHGEEEDEPIDVQSSNDPVCSRPESEATASSSEESAESSDEETPHSEDASAPKTTPNAPSKNTATKQAQSEIWGEEEIRHFSSSTPKQDTSATAAPMKGVEVFAETEVNTCDKKQVTVVGAGPEGCLLAISLEKFGFRVNLHEGRSDPREIEEVVSWRGIPLIINHHGRKALKQIADIDLEDRALSAHKLEGKRIHPAEGNPYTLPFGTESDECFFSVDRNTLTNCLLTKAESTPNITIVFNSHLSMVNLKDRTLTFHNGDGEIKTDFIFGCDGVHSMVRQQMMKLKGFHFDYKQKFEHAYKTLTMPAMAMESNFLHIWPRDGFMMAGLPHADRSFTLNLFMPPDKFKEIKTEQEFHSFFRDNFPETPIEIQNLDQVFSNPPENMVTIKCSPHYVDGSTVILGNAAHSSVFSVYGQGGFKDCLVYSKCLHEKGGDLSAAAKMYNDTRVEETHDLTDLSMKDYTKMCSPITSPSSE